MKAASGIRLGLMVAITLTFPLLCLSECNFTFNWYCPNCSKIGARTTGTEGPYQPLIDAYRAEPNPGDLELAIGIRGPVAPPTMCNGLQVPIVIFDQIYAFDRDSLFKSIAKPKEAEPKKFTTAIGEMFDRIMLQSDNAGATDCDRALNYLAVRYDRIYSLAAEQFAINASFTRINCMPSALSGTRKIVDVIFSFTDRGTDVVQNTSRVST